MRALVARHPVTAPVPEGIELFHVAEPEGGLALHPGTQADFEGAVADRIERTEGQAVETGVFPDLRRGRSAACRRTPQR
ncbi:hypothetical protein QW131_02135 [Roseibium salinum]|nr:hypothetical protein [Roseibium salinum]